MAIYPLSNLLGHMIFYMSSWHVVCEMVGLELRTLEIEIGILVIL